MSDLDQGRTIVPKPYCARITKRYFYDHVFGNRDGPNTLTDEEANQLTIYQGRPKTLAEIRCEVLESIDDLAVFYTSPAGQGVRDRDSRITNGSYCKPSTAIAMQS